MRSPAEGLRSGLRSRNKGSENHSDCHTPLSGWAVRVEVRGFVVRGFDCGDPLGLRLPSTNWGQPRRIHAHPKTLAWQTEGLRETFTPCPKTLSARERVCEGFSGHPNRLPCVQQALASPNWGEVVVPLIAAGMAARFLPRRPWHALLYLGSSWVCDDYDRPCRRSGTRYGRMVGRSFAPEGATVSTGIRTSRAP